MTGRSFELQLKLFCVNVWATWAQPWRMGEWSGFNSTSTECSRASQAAAHDGTFAGDIDIPWENTGNVVYRLVSMQNNRILADAEVQVISRDLRDSRRRRRHVWSIL